MKVTDNLFYDLVETAKAINEHEGNNHYIAEIKRKIRAANAERFSNLKEMARKNLQDEGYLQK